MDLAKIQRIDLTSDLGFSLETHLVHTEDGYVLQV
jgi:hypothetical protein